MFPFYFDILFVRQPIFRFAKNGNKRTKFLRLLPMCRTKYQPGSLGFRCSSRLAIRRDCGGAIFMMQQNLITPLERFASNSQSPKRKESLSEIIYLYIHMLCIYIFFLQVCFYLPPRKMPRFDFIFSYIKKIYKNI